ncbi:hypothetical protein GCM10010394_18830 [Streptomyces crystallinus]|uniref:Uncharacterized protein n=1 Tax=Streptomyces crystallinus TaxID=68191 RepID=A0ABN1FFH3_9ACTN
MSTRAADGARRHRGTPRAWPPRPSPGERVPGGRGGNPPDGGAAVSPGPPRAPGTGPRPMWPDTRRSEMLGRNAAQGRVRTRCDTKGAHAMQVASTPWVRDDVHGG